MARGRPNWWVILAVSLALMALLVATAGSAPQRRHGAADAGRAPSGGPADADTVRRVRRPASGAGQRAVDDDHDAPTHPTRTGRRSTDVARHCSHVGHARRSAARRRAAPAGVTTTTTGDRHDDHDHDRGASVPADRTQTQGYLNPPLQPSNKFGFTGTRCHGDLRASGPGDTYLTMEVSCPSGNQSVGGTSAMAASLPDASGSCLATVSEPTSEIDLADLHHHHRPRRWLGRPARARPRRSSTSSARRCAALLAFTAVPAVLVVVVGNPAVGRPRARLAAAASVTPVPPRRWRPGWPGPPAARSSCAPWSRTCARGEVGGAAGLVGPRPRGGPDRLRRPRPHELRAHPSPSRRLLAPAPRPGGHARHRRTARRRRHPAGAPSRPRPGATYAVQPGDTLWSIADDRLGDGADWTALAALNLGRDHGGGGARFVDPDQLRAGWRLRLPRRPAPVDAAPASRTPPDGATAAEPAGHLPELVALGLGSLACAALARRAGRRRRVATVHRRPRPRRARCQTRPWTRRRCCTASTASRRSVRSKPPTACWAGRCRTSRPAPRSVRSACPPSGVTFWLTAPHGDAPGGFAPVGDGSGMARGPAHTRRGTTPFFPVPARRASRRRRRRGHLARPARDRATCCPSSGSRRRALAGGAGRRRSVGLVGHVARDRRSRRPGSRRPRWARIRSVARHVALLR